MNAQIFSANKPYSNDAIVMKIIYNNGASSIRAFPSMVEADWYVSGNRSHILRTEIL